MVCSLIHSCIFHTCLVITNCYLKAFSFSSQEFLKKEFSDENIVFWIACENFRNLTEFEQVGCTGLTSIMTSVTIKSHGLL